MPELAIVVPTFNERANVEPLIAALDAALAGISFEIVFVDDDSPDGTADLVRSINQTDPRVRVLQRINRRGLASATVEGMMSTAAQCVAVIDGDLQHDETILPEMLALLRRSELDIVVGSRNVAGGSMGNFSAWRVRLSNLGRRLGRVVCRADLSDPMSGFFLLDRTFLEQTVRSLSGRGFKILLDLVASSQRPVRIGEIGYTFRNRLRGESKLDILVGVEYLELLCDKLLGDWFPVSYLLYVGVGSIGAILHLAVVRVLTVGVHLPFSSAQIASSALVIGVNYFLNNYVTFRSTRLRGAKLIYNLLLFYLACAVGLIMNLETARVLRADGITWQMASVAGLGVSSVWNYWISSLFVWRTHRRRARLLGVQRLANGKIAAVVEGR